MENTNDMRISFSPNPRGGMRVLVFLVLLMLALYLGVSAKNAYDEGGMAKNTIAVSGDAKRLAKPDTAEASFTIHKQSASLETARGEVSQLSNKVVEYLKGQGVDEKDIKTTAYNIYPQEVYDSRPCISESGGPVICPPRKTAKTYVVEETLDVKIKNLDKAGDIIAGVSAHGVNQIGALTFTINDDEMEKLKAEVRDEAMSKAKAKARALAGNLGVRLGKLVSFSEGGAPTPIFYEKLAQGAASADVVPPAPTITPGQNEIVSSVSLVYEIR